MNTSSKLFNAVTISIIFLLSSVSIYFYLKSTEKKSAPTVISQNSGKTNKTTSANSTSKYTPSPYTQPAATSNTPSKPAETYVVKNGETLFMISTKLNISWTNIAVVNNISNTDLIKADQILIIPSVDQKTNKLAVIFQVDQIKTSELQNQSNGNPTSSRLDPVKTAQNDSASIYGLTSSDIFTFSTKNDYEGTSIVKASHNDKNYDIYLNQPITKGKQGIWAISKIVPQD